MKGSIESDSSTPSYCMLSKEAKLYWKPDGSNNLKKWKEDALQAAKGKFGIYAACLESGTIPIE